MSPSFDVIRDNTTLDAKFSKLQAGDIVATRIRLKKFEEHLLLDLVERGIRLIPSARAQLASRSKAFQARLLEPLMIPGTKVIYDSHSLLETISTFRQKSHGKVVVKHDRKNAGQGIFLFQSIEDVYSLAANNSLPFPFVIQPFIDNCRDVRIIILGDYQEAYSRYNPYNFRNNLHCGGDATPYTLSRDQLDFCKEVMSRGGFPYAHLDLMITEDDHTYLAEINLRGGMRGAMITLEKYKKKVAEIHDNLITALRH